LGKNGLVTQEIARDLICLDLGRKVKTTSEYASPFRAGQEIAQKAFKTMKDAGAIVLESQGHLGTYLVKQRLSLLWAFSGLGTVTGHSC
jgi:DNA-binding transcriptional regulator YhcF (GntR family)